MVEYFGKLKLYLVQVKPSLCDGNSLPANSWPNKPSFQKLMVDSIHYCHAWELDFERVEWREG